MRATTTVRFPWRLNDSRIIPDVPSSSHPRELLAKEIDRANPEPGATRDKHTVTAGEANGQNRAGWRPPVSTVSGFAALRGAQHFGSVGGRGPRGHR